MRRAKKSKAATSKPARTQSNAEKTLKHIDETNSAAIIPVRRSKRNRRNKPDSIPKKQGLRSAVPPSFTVGEEIERGRETAKRGTSAKHSTEANQGGIEELESTGPVPPGSDKRNEQKDSEKILSVAQITKTRSKSRLKRKTRDRRFQKAKFDPETPIQPDKQSTKGEIGQPGQGAAVKGRKKIPLQSPKSLPKPSNGSKNLTQELLEDDILIPESAPENWDYVYSETQPTQSDNQNAEDEDKPYIDPQEAFNLKWGYLPPLDEEATRVIDFIIANPAMAASQSRIQAGTPAFGKGLGDRNVNLVPSNTPDPFKEHIQSLDVQTFMSEPKDEEIGHEVLWKLDQAKITATSSEAIFQRTIMVSLVARHFLIYQRNSYEKQRYVPLGTQRALSAVDEPMEGGQSTPRQPSYVPKIPSSLKRKIDDLDEIEVTARSQHEDTSISKRQRAEAVIG